MSSEHEAHYDSEIHCNFCETSNLHMSKKHEVMSSKLSWQLDKHIVQ